MKMNNIRSRIARSVGLAGLVTSLSLASPENSEAETKFFEDANFSGSLSAGVYVPPNEGIGLGGIPLGVSLEFDYGNNSAGFVLGGGRYFKNGFKRVVRDYSERSNTGEWGRKRESDKESFTATRINGGLRFGYPLTNLTGGWAIVEDGDLFETKRRKGIFGRREETTSFPSSEVWHGPYIQLKIGKEIDERYGLGPFFKWSLDYLTRREMEPFYTVRFELGINFGATKD